jgi:hypothetical protein
MKFCVALALAVVTVTSVGAIAETAEERQACMDDAFSVCGHAIPDRDRVETCLYENKSRISSACRAVLNKYSKPVSITAARTKAATVR